MDFSEALKLVKEGKCVARQGWHGKGMRVYLEGGLEATSVRHCGSRHELPLVLRPVLVLVLPDGSAQPGWLASQTDLLAEDWLEIK